MQLLSLFALCPITGQAKKETWVLPWYKQEIQTMKVPTHSRGPSPQPHLLATRKFMPVFSLLSQAISDLLERPACSSHN